MAAEIVVLCPGIRAGESIACLCTCPVEISSIPIYVSVISIAVVPEIVLSVSVVCVVVRMVSAVVVASVPSRVSVKIVMVVNDCATVPVASPCAPSPSATPATVHQCTDCDSGAEPDNSSCSHIAGTVTGSDVRIVVNRCRIVLRNIHDVGIRGFNHNGLRRLLNNFN